MADMQLSRPAAGQQILLQNAENARLVLEFSPAEATLERENDNLVFKFEDGGSVVLSNFYTAYTSESLPTFQIDGAEISGQDFFAALDSSLMPAAGPAAAAAPAAGGRFNNFGTSDLLDGIDRLDGLDIGFDGTAEEEDQNVPGVGATAGDATAVADAGTAAGSSGDSSTGADSGGGKDDGGDSGKTNTTPIIDGQSTDAAALVFESGVGREEDGSLSSDANQTFTGVAATGKVTASDADGDALSYSVALKTDAAPYGTMTIDAEGQYTYKLNDAAADSLPMGETIEHVYTVTVSDGKGGVATQDITVTIVGTNDAPTIAVSTPAPAITESANAAPDSVLSTTGTLALGDVDAGAKLTLSASAPVSITGVELTPEQLAALQAIELKFSDVANLPHGSAPTFTYSVKESDIDFLSLGQSLQVTYNVTVTDEHGATSMQPVTITINGAYTVEDSLADFTLDVKATGSFGKNGVNVEHTRDSFDNDGYFEWVDTGTQGESGSGSPLMWDGSLKSNGDGAFNGQGDASLYHSRVEGKLDLTATSGGKVTSLEFDAQNGQVEFTVFNYGQPDAAQELKPVETFAGVSGQHFTDKGKTGDAGFVSAYQQMLDYYAWQQALKTDPGAQRESFEKAGTVHDLPDALYRASDMTEAQAAHPNWSAGTFFDAAGVQKGFLVSHKDASGTPGDQYYWKGYDSYDLNFIVTEYGVVVYSDTVGTDNSNLNNHIRFFLDSGSPAVKALAEDQLTQLSFDIVVNGHSKTMVLNIYGSNDAPELSVVDLNKGQDGVFHDNDHTGKLDVIDPDAGDKHTFLVKDNNAYDADGNLVGTLNVDPDGNYAFMPNAAYQHTFMGQTSATFTITVQDSHGAVSNDVTLSFTVDGTNKAPEALKTPEIDATAVTTTTHIFIGNSGGTEAPGSAVNECLNGKGYVLGTTNENLTVNKGTVYSANGTGKGNEVHNLRELSSMDDTFEVNSTEAFFSNFFQTTDGQKFEGPEALSEAGFAITLSTAALLSLNSNPELEAQIMADIKSGKVLHITSDADMGTDVWNAAQGLGAAAVIYDGTLSLGTGSKHFDGFFFVTGNFKNGSHSDFRGGFAVAGNMTNNSNFQIYITEAFKPDPSDDESTGGIYITKTSTEYMPLVITPEMLASDPNADDAFSFVPGTLSLIQGGDFYSCTLVDGNIILTPLQGVVEEGAAPPPSSVTVAFTVVDEHGAQATLETTVNITWDTANHDGEKGIVLQGTESADSLHGSIGNDVLYGGDGDDQLFGGAGDDQLFGGEGDDLIFAGLGDDYLNGGEGEDVLFGGAGDDLIAFDANDVLIDGGEGMDVLLGGANDLDALKEGLADGTIQNVEVLIAGKGVESLTSMAELAETLNITFNDEHEVEFSEAWTQDAANTVEGYDAYTMTTENDDAITVLVQQKQLDTSGA